MRFGTVTDVQPGICTVQVAGGEIPVIYLKGSTPKVGEFVAVHRQGVVSYLLNPPSGALWVGDSNLNGIWRVPTSGQDPIFYPISGLSVYGVVEGPDTAIYACGLTASGGGVARMVSKGTAIGQYTQQALGSSPNTNPVGVCVGSDGNLWVADSNGYAWKVTPALAGTSYAVAGGIPQAICAGPDKNLWLALENSSPTPGAVARVTTSGVGTSLTLAGSIPNAICLGPDGNLWVAASAIDTETVYPAVWRVTPALAAVRFALPGPSPVAAAAPYSIATGSDNKLWTGGVPNESTLSAVIWATTAQGSSDSYPIGAAGVVLPYYLCLGSDSAIWVSDSQSAAPGVWRVTTNGQATNYPFPNASASPSAICSGP